ncbi:MAG: single-stranded DNA-binding protein [Oscillospiraceae bacterium]|jgi:single-stranded DNA-binding protein|nr:single-stranded DNA-binding protein [Oscillospiraceae bacterium]
MNSVFLRGTLAKPPEWSHTSHEARFFRLWLDVCRLSGKHDRLRVLAGEDALRCGGLPEGAGVEISGQMRTYNNKSGVGGRLIVSALARDAALSDGPHENKVLLSGTLCRPPGYRKTPLGREICDIMLAVPRTYSRTDYLPLIAWGGAARACAVMETGQSLYVAGRFQSRAYTKVIDGESVDMTAYEISVIRLAESEEELTDPPPDPE